MIIVIKLATITIKLGITILALNELYIISNPKTIIITAIIKHIKENPNFIVPAFRANEVLNQLEDIEDISDMISDVTQYLIETSKMYKWGNGEPYSDINLSFADFNYIIGKIKNFVNVNQSDSILLNKLKWNKEASLYTK
jgi:hypothetical protein